MTNTPAPSASQKNSAPSAMNSASGFLSGLSVTDICSGKRATVDRESLHGYSTNICLASRFTSSMSRIGRSMSSTPSNSRKKPM